MFKVRVPMRAKDEPNRMLADDLADLRPEHQRIIRAMRLRVLREHGDLP